MNKKNPAVPAAEKSDNSIFKLLIGIVVFAIGLAIPAPEAIGEDGWKVICVAALMLIWWITEAAPIPVTALTPIILFPALGILTLKEATANYSNPLVFLFMGGFVIALAMERWNLHRRIALGILRLTGTHANGIIAGFMIATAFLSMWMSNTATTVMMLPIALSVLHLLLGDERDSSDIKKSQKYFALSVMIGIAYAANIGGTATIIGTPPNAILAAFIESQYNYTIEFADWVMIGLPFAGLMLFACWFVLTHIVYRSGVGHIEGADKIINDEWKKLGKFSAGEKRVLAVFLGAAGMWMFKGFLPFDKISDTTIAMTAAVMLFLIPIDHKKGTFVLAWEDTSRLPWGILMLFGGGLTLASAMQASGLIQLVGSSITGLSAYGMLLMLLAICVIVLVMTECMSNMALITIFLPVLSGIATQLTQNPLFFMIPATFAASCAFMLPMATPPNAIVFASGYIRIMDMVKAGFIMNILAVTLITFSAYTLLSWVLGVEIGIVPDWAK